MDKAVKTRMLMENFNKYLNESEQIPLKEKMMTILHKFFDKFGDGYMESFNFASESAIWHFANEYHSGMNGQLYQILSSSKYEPGRNETSIEDTHDEIAVHMYKLLVKKFGKQNL